jgi:hypothetical protein
VETEGQTFLRIAIVEMIANWRGNVKTGY